MASFLLVHGSYQGAWCWRDVLPAMTALGHQVTAIDLPGHGADPTPIKNITFAGFLNAILAASTPNTIVVGHSMSGFLISAAAEHAPRKMAHLVNLCGYIPQEGLSLSDLRDAAPGKVLSSAIRTSRDRLSITLDPSQIENMFYHDCPDGTFIYAGARLCPEAIAPQYTSVSPFKAYNSVRKSYIRCTKDRVIPPEYQQSMTKDWPAENVYEIATGHSPFFANPVGLASLLDQIAKDAA